MMKIIEIEKSSRNIDITHENLEELLMANAT